MILNNIKNAYLGNNQIKKIIFKDLIIFPKKELPYIKLNKTHIWFDDTINILDYIKILSNTNWKIK